MKKYLSIILVLLLVLGTMTFPTFAEPYVLQEEGYDVYEIQYILKQYGYFGAECTGYYGEQTQAAVKAFQIDRGLTANGQADADTVAAIREAGCTEAGVNIKSMLNVWEEPSNASDVIDVLTRSSHVYMYSQKDGWYHIETENGVQGFVSEKYLTPGPLVGIAGVIIGTDSAVNVREKPENDAKVLFKVNKDAEVWVISGSGDWFQIDVDGKIGYIFKKFVNIGNESGAATKVENFTDPWRGSVTASSLKVRSGPSTGYDVISTLNKGTVISVIGEAKGWYYVQLNDGRKGFVSMDYIQRGTGATTCTISLPSGGTLNIRKGPGTNYGIVTSVNNGAVIYLLDDSTDWYKVKTVSGKEGYVKGSYVKLGGTVVIPTATPSIINGVPTGTYKQGSEGNNVTLIQKQLKALGYFSGTATGYYGTATVTSVKKFQKDQKMTQNGICDQTTLKALFSAKPKATATPKATAKATTAPGKTDAPNVTAPPSNKELGEQIADYVQNFLGVPYLLGGNGPKTFDCSGLTRYVYNHFGIYIPRTAYEQGYGIGNNWNKGTKITKISDLQPGDLVFWNTVNDSDLCDLVGIYIGNGNVVHASSGSAHKVVISSMSGSYYKNNFSWGRRII